MIAAQVTVEESNWRWFIVFLKELKPYQIRYIENILKEVEDYKKHNDGYKVPPDNYELIIWIAKNYTGIISSYSGLLIVMESCDQPYGKQTIFSE